MVWHADSPERHRPATTPQESLGRMENLEER